MRKSRGQRRCRLARVYGLVLLTASANSLATVGQVLNAGAVVVAAGIGVVGAVLVWVGR